jgi:catechol 2,3-dioxygenase-like lactoylglutathione lyase family enzyme
LTKIFPRSDQPSSFDDSIETKETCVKNLQTQGVHHITLVGADRQTSIDFWEGVLGMPFVFEQPNLDVPEQNHLYFDPGDGRLITVFTNENNKPDPTHNPEGIGNLHHIAFAVSRATFTQVAKRLKERGIAHSGEKDRGFMDSIYFRDPLGQLYELACYKFVPPAGVTEVEVLLEAHKLRVTANAYNITDEYLADAIEILTQRTTHSLSEDRGPKDPYQR